MRLITGRRLSSPSIVPNRHIDPAARLVLQELGWVRVPAKRDLWYAPCHRGNGLIDAAWREKLELDTAARVKGVRLVSEREESALSSSTPASK